MSTRRIAEILGALADIEHVRIVRIGSKMPAFDPWRLRRDPELQRVLRDHPRDRQRIYLMAHFDHPRELTAEALPSSKPGTRRVTAVNQCPLIRGINDRPEVLAELWSRLSYGGLPALLPVPGRPTAGNAPYEIPIVEGWSIFQQALACGSGLARRARFVMSHATGKIEIVAVDRSSIYLRYHQAKDPADLGRFLVAERNDTGRLARRAPDPRLDQRGPRREKHDKAPVARVPAAARRQQPAAAQRPRRKDRRRDRSRQVGGRDGPGACRARRGRAAGQDRRLVRELHQRIPRSGQCATASPKRLRARKWNARTCSPFCASSCATGCSPTRGGTLPPARRRKTNGPLTTPLPHAANTP